MKLVCHIGTPKTASTFLQNTCATNPRWLERHGVVYPDMLTWHPNHITLFYAASEGIHDFARDYGLKTAEDVVQLRRKLGDGIREQIAEAPRGAHTMLMSSENLTGNLKGKQGLRNLSDLLAPHFEEMRFVVYLRRQDDALLSMYAEFMRRGFSSATFEQFLKNALGKEATVPYLRYRQLLTAWIEVFGQDAISVRLFDPARLRGGDVLTDFMAEVLGEVPEDLAELQPSEEANSSLSAPALEFLRRMQPHIPFRKDGAANPARSRLNDRINRLPAKPRPQMSAAQSQRVMARFRGANDWLRDTFFPDHDGPLFADRRSAPEEGNLGRVTLKDFARFSGELLQ